MFLPKFTDSKEIVTAQQNFGRLEANKMAAAISANGLHL